jgi:hypothetical protein
MLAWLRDLNSRERGTMRGLAWGLTLLAAAGAAQADEIRDVPAVGTKLTYRAVTMTKLPSRTIGGGQIYTYIVNTSDGTTAEGSLRPDAMIFDCTGGTANLGCQDAAQTAGAHFDGDLLTVPIPGNAAEALAPQGSFKLIHFLLVSRKLPILSSRDPEKHNLGDLGPDPAYVLINTLKCDLTALPDFFPLGKSPKVTLPCETDFERTAARDGLLPPLSVHDTVSMEISYAGNGWVTVPSGSWQVHKLNTKLVPKDPSHPTSETESLFSTQLGVIVRSHTIGTNPANQSTTENTVELISVAP